MVRLVSRSCIHCVLHVPLFPGGALATWNQPIEVVRVEMQSMVKDKSANRPAKPGVFNILAYVYRENGIKGLYRGVTPRIGLGIWQTVCMVSFADYVKVW